MGHIIDFHCYGSLKAPRPEPERAAVIGEYGYAHPVFDLAAIRAQGQMPALQGQQHTWFAGAWMGYGFHEDGLKAGLQAARALIDAHGLAPRQATRPGTRLSRAMSGCSCSARR